MATKKPQSLSLQDDLIITPLSRRKMESINFIPFPANHCLSMKESSITIAISNNLLSRFLIPKHFLLFQRLFQFPLNLQQSTHQVRRVHSFQLLLHASQSSL